MHPLSSLQQDLPPPQTSQLAVLYFIYASTKCLHIPQGKDMFTLTWKCWLDSPKGEEGSVVGRKLSLHSLFLGSQWGCLLRKKTDQTEERELSSEDHLRLSRGLKSPSEMGLHFLNEGRAPIAFLRHRGSQYLRDAAQDPGLLCQLLLHRNAAAVGIIRKPAGNSSSTWLSSVS